jgi:hypothetical protein
MDHNRTPKFFVKFAMKGIGRGFTGFNFTSREISSSPRVIYPRDDVPAKGDYSAQ